MLACPPPPIQADAATACRAGPQPTEVGGYRIRRLIARGRSAAIYLAEDPCHGEPVALKVLHAPRPDVDPSGGRFAAECAFLGAIRNEHVVRILGQQVLGDPPYLAMEYLAGGALRRQMGAPMDQARALSLVRQAALGLGSVHRRGLVHRDVKPENLLLRSNGTLALADFGLAARQGDRTARAGAGRLVGTLCYAAPEQLQGEAPEPSADVYSLGVIFFELLSGRPPFSGKTALETLAQHLVAPVPRLAAGLEPYQPLIDAMLAKQAARRPADGRAVLESICRLAPAGPRRN